MPLIMWFFSAAFIASLARVMVAGLGIGILTYIGLDYVLVWFDSYLSNLYNHDLRLNKVLHRVGFPTIVSILMAAWGVKIFLTALRQLRLIR